MRKIVRINSSGEFYALSLNTKINYRGIPLYTGPAQGREGRIEVVVGWGSRHLGESSGRAA